MISRFKEEGGLGTAAIDNLEALHAIIYKMSLLFEDQLATALMCFCLRR